MAKIIAFGIKIQGIDKEIASVGELKREINLAREAADNVDRTDAEGSRRADERLARATEARRQYNVALRDTQKAIESASVNEGSVVDLQNRLTVLRKELDELGRTDRNGSAGDSLKRSISEIEQELKSVRQESNLTESALSETFEPGSVLELKRSLSSLKDSLDSLSREDRNGIAGDVLKQSIAEVGIELKEVRQEIRQTEKAFASGVDTDGSYRQLQNTLSVLKREFKELSAEERRGDIGKQLRNNIKATSDELKKIDAELGDYFRNVGDYEGGVVGALQRLDFGGLLRGDFSSVGNLADGLDKASDSAAGLGVQAGALGPAFAFGAIAAGLTGVVALLNESVEKTREAKQLLSVGGGIQEGAELNSTTGALLALSEELGESTQSTFQAANAVARTYNITLEESLELLRDATLSGANVTGDLLDQAREYPVFFEELGVSASQFFSIISQSVTQGIFSDKGVDAIKEATISLRELPKPARDAVNALGIDDATIQRIKAEDGVLGLTQLVIDKLGEIDPQSEVAGQALADIFKGAGEDAGLRFVSTLDLTNKGIKDQIDLSNRLVREQKDRLDLIAEIREEQAKIESSIGPTVARLELLRTKAEGNLFKFFGGLVDIIQDTVDAFSGVTKEAEILTGVFNKQSDRVRTLQSDLVPLLDRYDELQGKGELANEEQEELNGLVQQIGEIMPTAITSIDDYGRALGISAGKARELIDAEQARLRYINSDLIDAETASIAKLKERRDELQELIRVGREAVPAGSRPQVGFFASDEELELTLSTELSEERRRGILEETASLTEKILGAETQLAKLRGDVEITGNTDPDPVDPVDPGGAGGAPTSPTTDSEEVKTARITLTGLRKVQEDLAEVEARIASSVATGGAAQALNAQRDQLQILEQILIEEGDRVTAEALAILPDLDSQAQAAFASLSDPGVDKDSVLKQIVDAGVERAKIITGIQQLQDGLASPEELADLSASVARFNDQAAIDASNARLGASQPLDQNEITAVTQGEESDPTEGLLEQWEGYYSGLNALGDDYLAKDKERQERQASAYEATAEILSGAISSAFQDGEFSAEEFTRSLLRGIIQVIRARSLEAFATALATNPTPIGIANAGIQLVAIQALAATAEGLLSFAEGGDVPVDSTGRIRGRSHGTGGIDINVQGGEHITKTQAVRDQRVRTYSGTNAQILNAINTSAGGRAMGWHDAKANTFMEGGDIPLTGSQVRVISNSIQAAETTSTPLSDQDINKLGNAIAVGAEKGIVRAEDNKQIKTPLIAG